jgi:SAM-dependent methyltransferase
VTNHRYSESHQHERSGRAYVEGISSTYYAYVWNRLEQPLLEEALRECKSDGPALDVACGTGRITAFVATRFRHTVGVDVSRSMLEQARRTSRGIRFVQGDVAKKRGTRIRYSLITAFRFFQNAEPALRMQVLNRIAEKLAPHGVALVNLHANPTSLYGIYHTLRRLLGLRAHRGTSLGDIRASLPSELAIGAVHPYGFWPRIFYIGQSGNVIADAFERLASHLSLGCRLRLAQHILITIHRRETL